MDRQDQDRNLVDIVSEIVTKWMDNGGVSNDALRCMQVNAIDTLMGTVEHDDNALSLRQAAVTLLSIELSKMDNLNATLGSLRDSVVNQ